MSSGDKALDDEAIAIINSDAHPYVRKTALLGLALLEILRDRQDEEEIE